MDINVRHSGSFKNIEKFLKEYNTQRMINILEQLGQMGVAALASATPIDSGITAESWGYTTIVKKNSFGITWTNDSFDNGASVALLIQYGHGTRNGGYVEGIDYINPAIQPVFDKILQTLWEEMTSL